MFFELQCTCFFYIMLKSMAIPNVEIYFFLFSLGDERLKETNTSSGSEADSYDDVHHSKMEKQAKVIQNGFNSEPLEEDSCDKESTQKSHATDARGLCPVGPQKATLLYPLQIFGKGRNVLLGYY